HFSENIILSFCCWYPYKPFHSLAALSDYFSCFLFNLRIIFHAFTNLSGYIFCACQKQSYSRNRKNKNEKSPESTFFDMHFSAPYPPGHIFRQRMHRLGQNPAHQKREHNRKDIFHAQDYSCCHSHLQNNFFYLHLASPLFLFS